MKRQVFSIILYFLLGNMTMAAPMVFKDASKQVGGCYVGCQWIAAEGEITKDTPELLRNFLAGRKPYFEVALHSQGGDLLSAIEMGRILNRYKATVYLTKTIEVEDFFKTGRPNYDQEAGHCLDACVFAYLGGWKRLFYSEDLAFKPYQPVLAGDRNEGLTSEQQRELTEIAFINAYAEEMHFNPDFIYLGYDREAVHRLMQNEAVRFSIRYDPKEFGNWALEIENNQLMALTRSRDGEESVRIACGIDKQAYIVWHIAANRGNNVEALNELAQSPDTNLLLLGQDVRLSGRDFRLNNGKLIFSHIIDDFKSDALENAFSVLSIGGLSRADDVQIETSFSDYQSLKTMVPMVIENCLKDKVRY